MGIRLPAGEVTGKRLGGFIGVPGAQAQVTTQSQTVDLSGVSVTFTKGARPVRAVVSCDAVFHTLTTRWPYLVVRNSADADIYAHIVPIIAANTAIPIDFFFEPASQPAAGEVTWKLSFRNSSLATPGTGTIATTANVQLIVYSV